MPRPSKKSRLQNNLTRHPMLLKQQVPENEAGNVGKRAEKKGLPAKVYLDSAESCTYEVPQSQISSTKTGFRTESVVFEQGAIRDDCIDIIFSDQRKHVNNTNKIRAYNLSNTGLRRHNFSRDQYNFVIFGASKALLLDKSFRSMSTFTIRSPFVIFNRTDVHYALKIVIKQKVSASPK